MNISKSLPIVAKAMGDQMGVNVVIRGVEAMTNGKTIYLPELPKDDAEATLLARGFLDHEAAHVRLTDFSVINNDNNPSLKNLINIIEDIRIEQKMGQIYPGCAVNLRNLANHLAETGSFDFDPDQPDQLFLGWVLARCRSKVLGQNGLDPIFTKSNQILEPALGAELFGKISKLLDNVGNLKTTREAKTVAVRIFQLLRQEQQQQQSSEPSSEEEQGQDQQDQNSRSESNQDNETDDSDDTSEETGSQQELNQDDDSENSQQGKDSSESTPDAKNLSQNNKTSADILNQILNSSADEDYGDIGEMVGAELEAKAEETTPATAEMLYPGENGGDSSTFGCPPDLGTVRRHTSALRSRLGSLIQAAKLKRSCAGRSGRRIDQRVLCRLPVGDTRIFRRREERAAVNTAVLLLLDRSSSMTNRMSLAAEATLAVTDALYAIPGVSICSAAFPGPQGAVIPLTPFGIAPTQTLKKYGIEANGGTPLAHALGWTAVQFAIRQEPRKILVVATDGAPANPERVRTYLERLAEHGVEQMAIGIMDDGACGCFFRNHTIIQNIEDLPHAMFDMLKQTLIKRQ